jgi:hypothetical protein
MKINTGVERKAKLSGTAKYCGKAGKTVFSAKIKCRVRLEPHHFYGGGCIGNASRIMEVF